MSVPNLVSDRSPLLSLLIILLTVFFGVVIGQVLGIEMASKLYDGNLLNDIQSNRPGIYVPLLIMLGSGTLIGFIIFPIVHLVVLNENAFPLSFPVNTKPYLRFFWLWPSG